jgi:phosphinothricin acetyltransferase
MNKEKGGSVDRTAELTANAAPGPEAEPASEPARDTAAGLSVREGDACDLEAIRRIYNEGIEDRIATLDEDPKSVEDIQAWFAEHGGRFAVLVAERDGTVAGWASINRYAQRCAYAGVADLSVYVARAARGSGVGSALLAALEQAALARGFHKIVLFTFAFNVPARRLYAACGFREVGVFHEQGRLEGRFVDVLAMEKILLPACGETIPAASCSGAEVCGLARE